MSQDVPKVVFRRLGATVEDSPGPHSADERKPDGSPTGSTYAVPAIRPLDCVQSLQLGIEGTDETGNAERLRIASRLLEEHDRIDNDAYASAHWMSEPNTAKPFGIELIIKHRGDVHAAADDGGIRDEMRDYLGYQPHEVFINDEDGQRWEWFDGGRTNPRIQTEIDVAVVELKSQLRGGPPGPVLNEIAERWTRYHEAIDEADRTGHEPLVASDANSAVQAAACHRHDLPV